jgi:hypothetical protein
MVSTHFLSGIASYAEEGGESDEEEAAAYMAAAAAAAQAPRPHYLVSSTTPQFVLLSFDGSKSISMLNETLDFERDLAAEGKTLHFTYFINAVYFLTKPHAGVYQAPGKPIGLSNIGYSNTEADVAARVAAFNKAFIAGNEIASHSAGHFDGVRWTYDDWNKEFHSFDTLMRMIPGNNPDVPVPTPQFLFFDGFRAPQLGLNANLYTVEGDNGFLYDASGIGRMTAWPYKDQKGLWHIPIGTVYMGAKQSPAAAIDYSLWVYQSGAQEMAIKHTPLWDQYFTELENAYMHYFNSNYYGNRAPIVIADHFSKWNDGVYWEAMKQFARTVCGMPNVHCVTYNEFVQYLNANGTPPLAN